MCDLRTNIKRMGIIISEMIQNMKNLGPNNILWHDDQFDYYAF